MITIDDYIVANNKIKNLVNKTELLFENDIYIKKESLQKSGSFKWRGVLHSVYNAFENYVHNYINLKNNKYYMVTQSTGNHGIAVILSIYILKNYFSGLYKNINFNNIYPVIFTSKKVTNNKLNKMNKYMELIKNNKGFIDINSKNYDEALKKRLLFLKKNKGIYLSHGGKDILSGYGSLAFEIDNEIQNDKPFLFIATVGAGGPVGIFHCLSMLRPDSKFIIVQTKEYNCFIRSLKNNTIEYNNDETNEISNIISDGIAVNCPEEYALNLCKKLNYECFEIDSEIVNLYKKKSNYGNSTCITLKAFELMKEKLNINDYNVIILDCEGNN